MKKLIFALFILGLPLRSNVLIEAMNEELTRTYEDLAKEELPPYFISYGVTDIRTFNITSSFGKIINQRIDKERILDINLRVGSYDFDNTHIIRGQSFSFGSGSNSVKLPIDDNVEGIKQKIWLATDKEYKAAIERFEKAQTNKAVKIEEEDLSADLTKENPIVDISNEELKFEIDTNKWVDRLNRLSARFLSSQWIYSAQINLQVENLTKYFVNTEGSKLRWVEPTVRVMVYAKTKASDGMSLPLYKSYFSYSLDGLDSEEKMAKDVDELIATMDALRNAEMMDSYTGPAILSGEASGVFFHEIFGHRVEGHREKDPKSSQTFKKSIDKEILPDFIDVVFDPTSKYRRGIELSGNYPYDDQGQVGKKVVAVKDGKFKSFLMSRSPIEGFSNSNGHGRRQPGYRAVSRQSNLMVQAKKTVEIEKLKDQLLEECKKKGLEFGLMFDVVSGGFTFTGRTVPNAFNVMPLVVYKVYVDGSPDEIIRGVDLIGTPLTTFKNIIAAGDDLGVFNGICGAESGGVPVSASSPSILVSNIEVQKKKKSQAKLPILSPPNEKVD